MDLHPAAIDEFLILKTGLAWCLSHFFEKRANRALARFKQNPWRTINYTAMTSYNPSSTPSISTPTWGRLGFNQFISREPGFFPATGYHIYCELRPVEAFESAEDDKRISKFVRVIDRYAQLGEEAANQRGLVMLELQGRVLHFFFAGEATEANTNAVIDFVHEFTQSAYDDLREEMGDQWHGFAAAFDHGQCILLNHTSQQTLSTVSLGPSANNPAKRLFKKCPAGHVSAPSRLVRHITPARDEWTDINLRDRLTSPSRSGASLAESFSKIAHLARKDDDAIQNFSAAQGQNILRFSPNKPLRITGSVIRFDLDGFSALVEWAFSGGESAIVLLAQGFKTVMDYAEIVATAHQPCLMLPWAGDCATFVLPDLENVVQPLPRWMAFCNDWMAGEVNRHKSPVAHDAVLKGTKWGAGAAHGKTGKLVAATSIVQAHAFLYAVGAPQVTAKDAQESVKGDQLAIDSDDYAQLTSSLKQMFDFRNDEEYWVCVKPSDEKLKRVAAIAGVSAAAPTIITSSKQALPPPPVNRPYFS